MSDPALTLEIIVTDAEEAVLAQFGGAARLELVAARDRGGFTPPMDVVAAVCAAVSIPVNVIVRPHDRGFVYDERDRERMLADIARIRSCGADGIVFGALHPDGTVETSLLRAAIDAAAGLPLTFHRAFDATPLLEETYALLAAYPEVARILTAGGAAAAWEGRARVRDLAALHGPMVLAGGGIHIGNAAALVRETGVREVHVGSGARIGGVLQTSKIAEIVASLATLQRATGPAAGDGGRYWD